MNQRSRFSLLWRRLYRARLRMIWHLRRAEAAETPEDAAWWQAIR